MSDPVLTIVATGGHVQQQRMKTLAFNVSAAGANAYKAIQDEISDIGYINIARPGASSVGADKPIGFQIGIGVQMVGNYRNYESGPARTTGQPLDLFITAPHGFIAITLPNGNIGYTRAAVLKRNRNGNITTSKGHPLANGLNIPTNIPLASVKISPDGAVIAENPENTQENLEFGEIDIFTFSNLHGLQAIGDNMFVPTEAAGEVIQLDDPNGHLLQGSVEESNVKIIEEMTKLMDAEKIFQALMRIAKTSKELAKEVNNIQ